MATDSSPLRPAEHRCPRCGHGADEALVEQMARAIGDNHIVGFDNSSESERRAWRSDARVALEAIRDRIIIPRHTPPPPAKR